jgi:dihydrodipicolinate reductase
MGWHEILFGGPDEVLTIRHDEFDRKGYVATVSRAVREVMRPNVVGLIRGYDAVIGLGG